MNKKFFTNTLIAITFILGIILSSFGIYFKTQLATNPKPGDEEWVNPIFDETISIEWPEVSTDKLSQSIKGLNGELDIDEFESIFINEFSSQLEMLDIDDYIFDFDQDEDIIYITAEVDSLIYDGYIIDNRFEEYEYQYIVNS